MNMHTKVVDILNGEGECAIVVAMSKPADGRIMGLRNTLEETSGVAVALASPATWVPSSDGSSRVASMP